MFKKSNRVICRTIIHENTHNLVNIQIEQAWVSGGLFGGHQMLLRMLLEPPGKSEIFSCRFFSRYRAALLPHL